jgi:hypothetical protein
MNERFAPLGLPLIGSFVVRWGLGLLIEFLQGQGVASDASY